MKFLQKIDFKREGKKLLLLNTIKFKAILENDMRKKITFAGKQSFKEIKLVEEQNRKKIQVIRK